MPFFRHFLAQKPESNLFFNINDLVMSLYNAILLIYAIKPKRIGILVTPGTKITPILSKNHGKSWNAQNSSF